VKGGDVADTSLSMPGLRYKKSPPKEIVASEALVLQHKIIIIGGNQQPTLEVGSVRLLGFPALTKRAAASPFHCCLVSPSSRRAVVL
jgi:hypothetical protein